jgi:hypothetical protein
MSSLPIHHCTSLYITGGMRLVPYVKREAMMTYIRELFSDKEFCPFYFQYEFARILSGEEEAAFAWTGSNYLFKTLFPVRVCVCVCVRVCVWLWLFLYMCYWTALYCTV